MAESHLIPFYRGLRPDSCGRFLHDVQQQSLRDLESVHTYIQWMFPLPEPSAAVPNAPVLTREEVDEFRGDQGLKTELLKSFEVMLAFYGLEMTNVGDQMRVIPAPSFSTRSQVWLCPHNHNFLRMTRILRCLNQLGCQLHAHALFNALEDLYSRHSAIIGGETFRYWRLAVAAPVVC